MVEKWQIELSVTGEVTDRVSAASAVMTGGSVWRLWDALWFLKGSHSRELSDFSSAGHFPWVDNRGFGVDKQRYIYFFLLKIRVRAFASESMTVAEFEHLSDRSSVQVTSMCLTPVCQTDQTGGSWQSPSWSSSRADSFSHKPNMGNYTIWNMFSLE